MSGNAWFRLYAEFANDPKVQILSEAMQRRLIMVMCMRCSNVIETLHEAELAFHLRISETELAETKVLFIQKGFIDDCWNLLNWEKRQFKSDSSTDRVRAYRSKKRTEETLHETQVKRSGNAPDTDTDTDTDTDKEDTSPRGSVVSLAADRLPTCPHQAITDLYNRTLPELPAVRLLSDRRKRAIGTFWRWVLTSRKSDGQRRAETAAEAMDWIADFFDRARDNDFLMGRTQRSAEHAGWQCDFDFLMTDKGRVQVIEKTKVAA